MKRQPSLLIILVTVFIDLIGFGIVVPFLPLYSRDFGAHGVAIGAIFASYSAMQFIFSPIWGRLSDQYGRRPILLFSTAGACLSYVAFAVSSGLSNPTAALWLMVASRLFAGMCAGNITVAQAYIADITPPENRSKRMGLIGMAFGLGFIFGPALGGFGMHYFGLTGPGWIAAGFCGANFVLAFIILGESLKPGSEQARPRPHLDQWMHTLTRPAVGLLVIVFFLATFCFSCFESTLALLVSDNFHLNIDRTNPHQSATIGFLFVYCAVISAFLQGGAIGALVKRFGEPKLIAISLFITGASLALLPFQDGTTELSWKVLLHSAGWPWIKLLLVLALLSVGTSLTRPPLFGMISNLTPGNEQGATMGVAQGMGSLARIVGPIFATALYSPGFLGAAAAPSSGTLDRLLHHAGLIPYLACGLLAIATALLVAQRLAKGARAASAADQAQPKPATSQR